MANENDGGFLRNAKSGGVYGALVVDASGGAAPTGSATEAKQDVQITDLGGVTETAPATDTASSGLNGRLQRIAQRLTSLIALVPASLGQKTMANAFAVSIASDQSALPTREAANTTATLSNVNDTASSTTLLASNAARRGATIFNDSSASLYIKFGATASTTSFTHNMAASSYYEVPFGYTGTIDGIWSADSTGAARITEITA